MLALFVGGMSGCGGGSSACHDCAADSDQPARSSLQSVFKSVIDDVPVVAPETWTGLPVRLEIPDSYFSEANSTSSQDSELKLSPTPNHSAVELPWHHFALVKVDAAGIVQERFELTEDQFSYEEGQLTLFVSSRQNFRLDMLLVVDPKASPNINLMAPLPSGLLYTPFIDREPILGVASTLAYRLFLNELNNTQSFFEQGFDPELKNNRQGLLGYSHAIRQHLLSWAQSGQYTENQYTSIEALLQSFDHQQLITLNTEVSYLKRLSAVSAVDDARADGSISELWTWSVDDYRWWGYIDTQYKETGEVDQRHRNQFSDINQVGLTQSQHSDFGPGELRLTPDGWKEYRYLERHIEIDEDAIYLKTSNDIDELRIFTPTQSIALSGMSIKHVLSHLPELHHSDSPSSLKTAAQLVSEDARFSSEARLHRHLHTQYGSIRMRYKACELESSFNCDFAHLSTQPKFQHDNGRRPNTLTELISPYEGPKLYVEMPIELPDHNQYSAVLYDGVLNQVELYHQQHWNDDGAVARGYWQMITMGTGEQAIEISVNFFDDNKTAVYYLVQGPEGIHKAEKVPGETYPLVLAPQVPWRTFNRTAMEDILNAVDRWPPFL